MENYNVVAEYDYYTLEQARELVYAEMEQDRIRRKKAILKKRQAKIEEIKLTLGLGAMTLLPFGMFLYWLVFGYNF